MKKISLVLLLVLSLGLYSCSGNKENTITVAASPKPHAEILEYAKPLLKEKGYTLVVKPYNDYIMPNKALTLKQVDANFFQHEPYLNQYNADNKTNIVSIAKIHIEPIGIYSKKYSSLAEVENNAVVFISSSKSDHGRLLNLLVNANLITLKAGINPFQATLNDIAENPKNLQIRADIDPTSLVDAYKYNQADLILINSNFALDANINPGTEAIALERPNDNPFANIIATLPEYEDSPKIKALVDVLTSPAISEWILNKWNGDIVPFVEE
ncbi:MAG: methionine ABC transporter substrate-binding protein [Acholeplasmataceae bacterium]|jgi:D-methionine transport system substrate-binding protein|nr:methionine ABC transporter substrate-binding protein [Acholeplasmataceae bacterium]